MYPTLKNIHFVGIGGIGMSGLAEILLTLGCHVTGSDLKRSPVTDRLKRRGARIFLNHKAEHIGRAQVVVISSAVAKMNPELVKARELGIPVIARAEMLAELMRLKYGIAVAGSHGKTTTTSLVACVLEAGGLDPTVVIGGRVKSLRSNARLGKGDFLVAEADESDGSFLHLNPTIAVVTNIDREHMDHYKDFESLKQTFEAFVSRIPFYGLAIFCADHPESAALAATHRRNGKRGVTYGLTEKADYQALHVRSKGWSSTFEVKYQGESLGKITLRLPGQHNVLNSLAVVAVARELSVPWNNIRKALSSFGGIGRRLEVIYRGTATVIDDYGHHPEEIRATLEAVNSLKIRGNLWILFQPHRYTRTKDLFEDFIRVFADVLKSVKTHLVVTEIYAASEEPIHGVTGRSLVDILREEKSRKGQVDFVATVSEIPSHVLPELKTGDVVLTLGAGDIWKAGKELASLLAA